MEVYTAIELEPCPFCGGRATMNKDHPTDFYFFVKCWKCGARTQSEYTEEMAVRRWNRRTNR